MEQKYYVCEICGKIVEMVNDTAVPTMCCGQKMQEIVPGTVDAAKEKHIPVYSLDGNVLTVNVGEVDHPMVAEHYIEWVSIQTSQGLQRKNLSPETAPSVTFALSEGEVVEAVYAYCNLHGLWKAEVVEAPVCDLKPVDNKSTENYVICKCNNVSFFDILDEVHKHSDITNLLDIFENVKNTTHCSTGCGGCYDKVIDVISHEIMNG